MIITRLTFESAADLTSFRFYGEFECLISFGSQIDLGLHLMPTFEKCQTGTIFA
jgi:hypothetical protein